MSREMHEGAKYIHASDSDWVRKVQQPTQAVQKRKIQRRESCADEHKADELRCVGPCIFENPLPRTPRRGIPSR